MTSCVQEWKANRSDGWGGWKRIVGSLLKSGGFPVIDIDIDMPANQFAARNYES